MMRGILEIHSKKKLKADYLMSCRETNGWACYIPALCFSWICSFSLTDPLLQSVCANIPIMSWRLQQTWGYLRQLCLSFFLLPWKCALIGKVSKDWSTRLYLSYSPHGPTCPLPAASC